MSGEAHLVHKWVGDKDAEGSIMIDTYIAKTGIVPSVIKIDVEGAEVSVLRGARECLVGIGPQLLIEVHPRLIVRYEPNGISELGKFLSEASYAIDLCVNHRGKHRGPVEPWRNVSIPEFIEHCGSILNANGSNFAIHCYRSI